MFREAINIFSNKKAQEVIVDEEDKVIGVDIQFSSLAKISLFKEETLKILRE